MREGSAETGGGRRIVLGGEWEPEFDWVEQENISVDPGYQRDVNEQKVAGIAGRFDPSAFGILIISCRDGSYVIIDGQHRLLAWRKIGASAFVPCLVLHNLSRTDEAGLFLKYNDHPGVTALDRFKARLYKGDADALDIERAAQATGYRLPFGEGNGDTIRAVQALDDLYRRGGYSLLADTLSVLRAAWQDDAGATYGGIIAGLGDFLRRFGDSAKQSVLVRAMRGTTPKKLLRAVGDVHSSGIVSLGQVRYRYISWSIWSLYCRIEPLPNLYLRERADAS